LENLRVAELSAAFGSVVWEREVASYWLLEVLNEPVHREQVDPEV
jgi:hypothetical protein